MNVTTVESIRGPCGIISNLIGWGKGSREKEGAEYSRR